MKYKKGTTTTKKNMRNKKKTLSSKDLKKKLVFRDFGIYYAKFENDIGKRPVVILPKNLWNKLTRIDTYIENFDITKDKMLCNIDGKEYLKQPAIDMNEMIAVLKVTSKDQRYPLHAVHLNNFLSYGNVYTRIVYFIPKEWLFPVCFKRDLIALERKCVLDKMGKLYNEGRLFKIVF